MPTVDFRDDRQRLFQLIQWRAENFQMLDDQSHVPVQFDVALVRLQHHVADGFRVRFQILQFLRGLDRLVGLFETGQRLFEVAHLLGDIVMLTVQF